MRFLLRAEVVPLTTVTRRVLTGYAGTFKRRHHRHHGYHFQNRYKSILCQEEPYLLELVRYLGESECVAAALAAGGEGLKRRQLLRSVRQRSLLCYWAVQALGLPGTAVGARLGLTQPGVRRGARLAEEQGLAFPEG